MARYKGNVDTLKIVDNDIRYKADSFIFNVAGAPEEVKQFSGISRPESWGRWSNAQLGDEVKISTSIRCRRNLTGDYRQSIRQ